MHAAVGDQLIIAGATVGAPVREGEILEVHGAAGDPPYLVRWSDSGRESLFFPGPDSHVHHQEATPGEGETARSTVTNTVGSPPPAGPVRTWHVDLYVYEGDESTAAHAVLHAASDKQLNVRGEARRRPGDVNVPEIGDEVAVARALRGLADRLLAAASEDMSAVEGHDVRIES
jgi:Domain of unknown function (DUF1918)/Domain of unknown function (DUF1876)